jgi:hypothetical protein
MTGGVLGGESGGGGDGFAGLPQAGRKVMA